MKDIAIALIPVAMIITISTTFIHDSLVIQDQKKEIAALKTSNEAYERYYCATEEMLDIMPQPVVDSATCTEQGFRYLDEKEKVDSVCHNILP